MKTHPNNHKIKNTGLKLFFKNLSRYSFLTFLVFFFLISALALMIFLQIPSANKIRSCFTTSMYQVKLCPKSPEYVPLKRVSTIFKKTILLTEDSRFYHHQGFDWESIEKSAKENLSKGHYVRGGSTITQQLAKNLFLTKEKSLLRKLKEALITIKIEETLSKDEILERYLNVVEFGPGIYGIKAAANFYFKKSPIELDPTQSAFLAMLLPNPKSYSRSFHKKQLTSFAKKRMLKILTDLFQYSYISQTEYDIALNRLENPFVDPSLELPEEEENLTPEDLDKLLEEDL